MGRKIGIALQLPLYLLIAGSFGTGIYAAATDIAEIGWETPVTIGIIIALYVWGRIAQASSDK